MKDWLIAAVIALFTSAITPLEKVNERQLITWRIVGNWMVAVDRSLDNGCYALTQFYDGTEFRIGFDRRRINAVYVLLANRKWNLNHGASHSASFVFPDAYKRFETTGKVLELDKGRALLFLFRSVEIVTTFGVSNLMDIRLNDSPIALLGFKDSGEVVRELIECQVTIETAKVQ